MLLSKTEKLTEIWACVFVVIVATGGIVFAQSKNQTAVTRDGKVVILRGDGTWVYESETSSTATTQPSEKGTLLEVQTDQPAYVERPVTINGTLQLASTYLGGYQSNQDSYYAFHLGDSSQYATAFVYMKRGESAAKLRQMLLSNNGKIQGQFTINIFKERIRNPSDSFNKLGVVIAELVDYSALTSPPVVKVSPTTTLPDDANQPRKSQAPIVGAPPQTTVIPKSQARSNLATQDLALLEFLHNAASEGTGNWIHVWGSPKEKAQYFGDKIKRRNGDLFVWWRLEIADPVMTRGVKRVIDYRQVNCEFRRSRDLISAGQLTDGNIVDSEITLYSEWTKPREGTLGAQFIDDVCKAAKKIKE